MEIRIGGALLSMPQATQARLRSLAESLIETLGENLVAILAYGSAARGGFREGSSDVDLVIVLRKPAREPLQAISNALQIARHSARIEAMILAEEEVSRAADVFPLLYDDIRQHHWTIVGASPFDSLEIHDRYRRIRIEQELREARIRLRRAVVDSGNQLRSLGNVTLRKAKQIRGPLHALLTLKQLELPDDLAQVIARAEEVYDIPKGRILQAAEAPAEAHDALVLLLDRAIDEVDRMEGV